MSGGSAKSAGVSSTCRKEGRKNQQTNGKEKEQQEKEKKRNAPMASANRMLKR